MRLFFLILLLRKSLAFTPGELLAAAYRNMSMLNRHAKNRDSPEGVSLYCVGSAAACVSLAAKGLTSLLGCNLIGV